MSIVLVREDIYNDYDGSDELFVLQVEEPRQIRNSVLLMNVWGVSISSLMHILWCNCVDSKKSSRFYFPANKWICYVKFIIPDRALVSCLFFTPGTSSSILPAMLSLSLVICIFKMADCVLFWIAVGWSSSLLFIRKRVSCHPSLAIFLQMHASVYRFTLGGQRHSLVLLRLSFLHILLGHLFLLGKLMRRVSPAFRA